MPIYTESRLALLHRLYRRTVHDLASARRTEDRGRASLLQQLEERLDAEILAEGGTSLRLPTRKRRKTPADYVGDHIRVLGVTAHDVKVWAVGAGLLDAVRRGRIKGALVDAYATAHPTEGDHP